MTSILLAVLVFGLCFAGIAIRLLFKKDKEFRGTCASNNPLLRKDDGSCSVCGQKVTECPEEKEEEKAN